MVNLKNSQAQNNLASPISHDISNSVSQESERTSFTWRDKVKELREDIVRKISSYYERSLYYYSRYISCEYEKQLFAWQDKVKELGDDLVRRVNNYYKKDKYTYSGGAWTKWPISYMNDVLYSVIPISSGGLRGKAILSLRQQHNGVPADTIEIILQTTDANIAIIAEKAIKKFNEREKTSFKSKRYSGNRMDEIKYSRS